MNAGEGRRLLMIVNPRAGKQRGLRALRRLHVYFESEGYLVTDHVTNCKGDGLQVARQAAERFDILVAVGGDGTLNEVISGVMQSGARPAIGYIPTGSTNDFARSLGIPRKIMRAAHAIAEGKPAPFDVGRFGERNFTYVASFGAFARSSYSAPQRLKNLFGRTAYIFRGIADIGRIKPYRMKLAAEGRVIEDEFIFGAVSNSTSMGGLIKFNRSEVDFSDGLFEVMLVRPVRTAHALSRCLRSLATKNYYDNKEIIFFRTTRLVIETEAADIPWTLDGEYAEGEARLEIENLSAAVSIIVRPGARGLSSASPQREVLGENDEEPSEKTSEREDQNDPA